MAGNSETARQNGKLGGRPRGSKGAQVKSKYLAKWEQVFEDTNPIEKLTALAEKDYSEFIRLGLAAMPKNQKLDIDTNPFGDRSIEELNYYIANQKWSEDSIETEQV